MGTYTHLREPGGTIPDTSQALRTTARILAVHPGARRAARLLSAAFELLKAPLRPYADAMCAASPGLATIHALAMDFWRILDMHDPNALGPWLDAAEHTEIARRKLPSGPQRCARSHSLALEQWAGRRPSEQTQAHQAADVRPRRVPAGSTASARRLTSYLAQPDATPSSKATQAPFSIAVDTDTPTSRASLTSTFLQGFRPRSYYSL